MRGSKVLTRIESCLTALDKTRGAGKPRIARMPDQPQLRPHDPIRNIDMMARAAFTWVRQQAMEQRFLGLPVSAAEECELAAGFLAGLKARLGLCDSESILVAYVYALMRGERAGAAQTARDLLAREPGAAMSCAGYLHGLAAARNVLGEQHHRGEGKQLSESMANVRGVVN
jgi:hypothetical protein